MKTNALLATACLTFACMLGCDADEGPSDSVLESVDDAETPITEVDAAYIQAHADADGLVRLDFGADATAIYRVDADVLDEVELMSEHSSIVARQWLELVKLANFTYAESILFTTPNVADSLNSDEGFRLMVLCMQVEGDRICVLIDDQG